ncbi:MAG: FecR family protein [Cellvibrionaceae bacterium]
MKNLIQFPDSLNADDDAATQAAYWLAKMDSGLASPELFKDFLRWKRANPDNAAAYIELSQVFSEAGHEADMNQTDKPSIKPTLARDKSSNTQGRYLPFSLRISFAASLVMGLFVLLVAGLPFNSEVQLQTLDLSTQTGEQQSVDLGDGSHVLLNTQSVIKIRFQEHERSVHLISGEAHFDVAHDTKRPFKVYTEHGNVRAVGTAFSINLAHQELAVTVTEGRIAVTSPDTNGRHRNQPLAMVDAGHQVQVSDDTPKITPIDSRAMEKEIAWHHGLLIFDGDSLSSVIAQISRYTDARIVISDDDLGQVKIGGQFRTNEIHGLLESLDAGFGISSQDNGNNTIVLSRKKSNAPSESRI